MADNNFLSSMKIDQFIKTNNDQIKQTLSDTFGGITKSVSDIMKMQKLSNTKLQSIDNKLSDLSSMNKTISKIYDLQKIQLKVLGEKDEKLAKSIDQLMVKHYSKMSSSTQKKDTAKTQTKDYFKREDQMQDTEDLLSNVSKGIWTLVGSDKKKKSGNGLLGALGLLGSLGALLGLGGLMGFILTGKKEFLFSVAKGIRYAMKGLLNGLDTAFKTVKGITTAIKSGPKFFSTLLKNAKEFGSLGKIGSSFFGGMAKVAKSYKELGSIGMIAKSMTTFVTNMAKMGTTIADVSGTIGKTATSLLKIAKEGKILSTLAKSAKAIPTALKASSAASKASKAFKAAHMGTKGAKAGVIAGKAGAKLAGKSVAKRIPVLGTLMGIGFGISRISKGDVMGGLMEFGSAGLGLLDLVAPGVGTALSLAADVGIMARDMKRSKNPAKGGDDGFAPTADYGAINSKLFGSGAVESKQTYSASSKSIDTSATTSTGSSAGYKNSKKMLSQNKALSKSIRLNNGKGFRPDLLGLKPDMLARFTSMADEYQKATGGQLLVNSAKRSGGSSTHNFGYAIDVNATGKGGPYVPEKLLEKYGFHRPLQHWKDWYGGPKNEPWHIEPYPGEDVYGSPRNTLQAGNPQPYRFGALSQGNPSWMAVGGDDGVTSNLPKGKLEKTPVQKGPVQVQLSTQDIDKIASSLGKQIKDNTPAPAKRTPLPMGGASGRGNL